MNRNNTQLFKKGVRNQSDSMKIMQQKYSEQIYIVKNKQDVLRKFVLKLLASSEDNQCYYITPKSVFRTQSISTMECFRENIQPLTICVKPSSHLFN